MDWIRILLSRCAGLFGRRKVDQELDQELLTHIGFSIEENRGREGLSSLRNPKSRSFVRASAAGAFGYAVLHEKRATFVPPVFRSPFWL